MVCRGLNTSLEVYVFFFMSRCGSIVGARIFIIVYGCCS